ncbi:alkylated DNA repair protein alkB homolog 8 [Eurytemora carolleeae]|uniref:alkylated DNA repair protein alkB homolog 8 n=1 Tax=Eurytemora carolleeae TaxID=1294199 RepID=UPI000C7757B1|nr:alkylated DNA repair protein alkB homolog 8 [Eurytemora carolleeae]|eukprot:XP_023330645.1 alkylated DNA repair protein alkB homolog 8-like [Eurytemora affinis]
MEKDFKKVTRKQAKALQVARKDFEICESEKPSQNVLVCNAGLVTGASREALLSLFSGICSVENLILVPQKSYAFLVFPSLHDAQQGMERVNGKMSLDGKGPIYLSYILSVPEIQDPWVSAPPSGLHLIPEFISDLEETSLIEYFQRGFENSEEIGESGELKHRQVQHFGFKFDYTINDIDPDKPLLEPIPTVCEPLLSRLVEQGLIPELPDQLTVNLYLPGQGIPSHTDTHSCCTDWLCSVSLGSSILMEFKDTKGSIVPVWLPTRSALMLKDEARYCWKHGITPRHTDIVPFSVLSTSSQYPEIQNLGIENQDRVISNKGLTLVKRGTRMSLTFRRTMRGECKCRFPEFCNRGSGEVRKELENSAARVESSLVHEVYEEIASHFSETRHKPWPRVLEFIQDIPEGGVLLDLGCGNGKYLGHKPGLLEIGSDFSHNLLKIVTDRGFQGVRCDMLYPGFRDGFANGVICIAALHHLATEARRRDSVLAMARLLESGGRLLIYVWAKDQKKEEMSSYLKQNKKNFKRGESGEKKKQEKGEFGLPVHINRTVFEHQDVLVPWKLKPSNGVGEMKTLQRFYHVFEEGELENLVLSTGQFNLIETYYDEGNWCIIAERK